MTRRSGRQAIFDMALELAQKQGYNGFSYHDLSHRIGVTTASIHYHFKKKEDLGVALMVGYREAFAARLTAIERETTSATERISRFVGLFRETLRAGERLCLCGMLASEYATLPQSVRDEVRRFFVASEEWLTRVLDEGQRNGDLALSMSPVALGRNIFSALEGAMMSARAFSDESRLDGLGDWLLRTMAVGTST